MIKPYVCVLLLVFSSAACGFAQETPAQVTAIRAGKLIDVNAGRVLANQVILIRAGKIESIGGDVAIPSGANTLDLSKMTVLPGLIDATRTSPTVTRRPTLILPINSRDRRRRWFWNPYRTQKFFWKKASPACAMSESTAR